MGKYKLINKFTLISSLFIILILTTGMSNQNNSFSGKIFKNIYIEQVHVGKMKLDEAKDAVDKKYLLKPIYMKYKDKTWCINPQDIDLSYNTDDAVKNAYSYTRSDSNIENIKRKSFRELSGGQQQRVLLARALCATKKIIILDEPITGLDPTVTREMYSLIKEINKKGITIIMVSHDINFAVNNASKILHLKKNIKFFGNTEDYANSEVGRRFIGGAQID